MATGPLVVPLPLKLKYPGAVDVALTVDGLALGKSKPRVDLLVALWEGLTHALALGEVEFGRTVPPKIAARLQAEAAAALQVHLRGR